MSSGAERTAKPAAVDAVHDSASIEMPAPTAWPIVMAFGITLSCAGLVTSAAVSALGVAALAVSAVGWFRDVLPYEAVEAVRVDAAVPVVATRRLAVARLASARDLPRALLPIESYPIWSGVVGGLAGSVVMAFLAMLYGAVSGTGIWYPINLLVSGFFPGAAAATTADLAGYSSVALLLAVPIHLLTSVLVGLLYGAMLPMLPRHPVLLGGLVAPLMWSAVIHSVLGIVNPVMNDRIAWPWFVLSQVGFGLVAGGVVARRGRRPTHQLLPLAVRAGIESPGLHGERDR